MKLNHAVRTLTVAVLGLAMVGCASVSGMPLQARTKSVDTSEKSILVAKVKIRNENKTTHQPDLCCVFVSKTEGESSKLYSFTGPTLLADHGKDGKDYLVSMAVSPGKTKLNFVRFIRQVPLLLMAMADAQLDYDIDVPANRIVYLGSVDAIIVPRTDDSQPRAGSVIPLVDQAVAGFSNGTFRITISDQYEADTGEMLSRFPALAGKEIVKSVLPNKAPQTQVSQN